MDFNEELNERLEAIRVCLNLKQKEFAGVLGIQAGSYSDIKRGKVGVSTKIKKFIDEELGVNMKWFMTGVGEMFTDKDVSKMIYNYKNRIGKKSLKINIPDQALGSRDPEEKERFEIELRDLQIEINSLKRVLLEKDKLIAKLNEKFEKSLIEKDKQIEEWKKMFLESKELLKMYKDANK